MRTLIPAALLITIIWASCTKSEDVPVAPYDMQCPSDWHAVRVNLLGGFILPNGFSPNGDSLNDLLRLIPTDSLAIRSMQVNIIDSTGKRVCTLSQPEQGWDGTNPATGMKHPGVYRVNYNVVLSGKGVVADSTVSGHTCIWLFGPHPTQVGCLKLPDLSLINYLTFEDQIDPATSYAPYTTGENFCP
jgi:gliding motility-associated-like protein